MNDLTRQLFDREPLCNTTVFNQIAKARQELDELMMAIQLDNAEEILEEFADVLVCLTGAAHKVGITWSALTDAYYKKLQVNLVRTWTRQEDGTYQHD